LPTEAESAIIGSLHSLTVRCNVAQDARRDVIVPTGWADFYDATGIPAAIRTGDILRLTGHTGEDADGIYPVAVEDQIRATFRNVGLTLAAAGASWADVVEINSYHVGYRQQVEALLRIAAEFLDAPYPAWTGVGVTELFLPEALIEIRCVAVIPELSPEMPAPALPPLDPADNLGVSVF
jgi:enamine deaminase RidA (YjgF/YER057c/UK114 family)